MQRALASFTAAAFGARNTERPGVCGHCHGRFRTLWQVTRYSGDERCSHKMIRTVILAFRSECSGCIRAAYARLGKPGRDARESERGQLTLKACPSCANESLTFEFQRFDGRRWQSIAASSFKRMFAVAQVS